MTFVLDLKEPRNREDLTKFLSALPVYRNLGQTSHVEKIARMMEKTGAKKLLQELVSGDMACSPDGVFTHRNSGLCSQSGLESLTTAGVQWKEPDQAAAFVCIDPAQPGFLDKLANAATDKRLNEKKASLSDKGVPAGGELDKIMRRRIAGEVDKELWNGLPHKGSGRGAGDSMRSMGNSDPDNYR